MDEQEIQSWRLALERWDAEKTRELAEWEKRRYAEGGSIDTVDLGAAIQFRETQDTVDLLSAALDQVAEAKGQGQRELAEAKFYVALHASMEFEWVPEAVESKRESGPGQTDTEGDRSIAEPFRAVEETLERWKAVNRIGNDNVLLARLVLGLEGYVVAYVREMEDPTSDPFDYPDYEDPPANSVRLDVSDDAAGARHMAAMKENTPSIDFDGAQKLVVEAGAAQLAGDMDLAFAKANDFYLHTMISIKTDDLGPDGNLSRVQAGFFKRVFAELFGRGQSR